MNSLNVTDGSYTKPDFTPEKASSGVVGSKSNNHIVRKTDNTVCPETPITLRSAKTTVNFPSLPANLCQNDINTDGNNFQSKHICGPTAIANTLAPLLGMTSPEDQHALVIGLAEECGIDEEVEYGTGPIELMAGVRSFMEKMDQQVPEIRYYGWRAEYACPKSSFNHIQSKQPPSQQLIFENIRRSDGAWLNIGFYVYDEKAGEYTRKSGHWVTLAGCNGNDEMTIHDPAVRAHTPACQQKTHGVVSLDEGQLIDRARTRSAKDVLYLDSSFKLPNDERGINAAIIDGVIFFQRRNELTGSDSTSLPQSSVAMDES
ncbi:hypothetical protein [Endozoicomonas sp. SCSIO W0465]|uniref:hypothetical protein n=1 Tax=Endozoicomonas sp. SCSIO W0465 TaxID=2918516 RepID=UPI002075A23E|nr:hypothetical protein [Endozoicomonas sp. SCSIO W0465]USE35030.1 hypothetical protein MJO57_23380 [Endozoicomonas sp. SCSIO W0465]